MSTSRARSTVAKKPKNQKKKKKKNSKSSWTCQLTARPATGGRDRRRAASGLTARSRSCELLPCWSGSAQMAAHTYHAVGSATEHDEVEVTLSSSGCLAGDGECALFASGAGRGDAAKNKVRNPSHRGELCVCFVHGLPVESLYLSFTPGSLVDGLLLCRTFPSQ